VRVQGASLVKSVSKVQFVIKVFFNKEQQELLTETRLGCLGSTFYSPLYETS